MEKQTNLPIVPSTRPTTNIDVRNLFLNYWRKLELYPDYIDLGMGMPPAKMFLPALEAQNEFIEGRRIWQSAYQHQAGDVRLREELANYEMKRTGIAYTADNIMVVSGALRGFSLVLDCLATKSTHFVEIVPTYPLLAGQARNVSEKLGCSVSSIIPKDINTFQPTIDEIKRYIEPATILYLTNPNNPTGLYLREEVLNKIIETCEEKKAYIIIDEACDIPLRKREERGVRLDSPVVIRILSLSKMYLLAGFRLGYIIANHEHIKEFSEAFAFSDGNASIVGNLVISKYVGNPRLMDIISGITHNKVELSLHELSKCRSVSNTITPDGCYYIFLKINYTQSNWCLFSELISRGINIVPGCLFGVYEEPWIRICCGREDRILIDYLHRLMRSLESI